MQPIDYTRGFQPVDIAGSIAGGFNVGSGIRNELQRRQDEAVLRQRKEAEYVKSLQKQAAYERDLFDTFNDPSPQRLAKLQITYPERVKEFQAGFETLDKAQVAGDQAFVGKLYSAMRTNPEVADKLLTDRIAALTNAGEDASQEQAALDLLKSDPKQALGYVGSIAAFTLPKEQIEALAKLSETQRAEALAPAAQAKAEAEAVTAVTEATAAPARTAAELRKLDAEIRNVSSQAAERAARLDLDRARLDFDIRAKLAEFQNKPLSAGAEKIVNDSVAASVASEQSAERFESLAEELGKASAAGGAFGTGREATLQFFGAKDQLSALRQEYTRIRSQLAISSLPPGPATDRDIEIAFKGFPKETDPPAYIAQFLKGTAKLQKLDAIQQDAKAQWAQQNGNLGNARTDGTINGVPYKAGETLKEFTKRALAAPTPPAAPTQGGAFRIVRVR